MLLYGAFHHSIFTPFLPGAPGAVPELSLPSSNLFLLPNSGGGVLVRHPSAPLQRAARLGTDPLPGSARSCEVQTGSGTPGNPRGTRCRGWKTLGAARGWGAGRSPTTLAPHGKLRLGLPALRGQARCFFSPGPRDRTRGDGLRLRQGGVQVGDWGNFFAERVVRGWARLPRAVGESPSLEGCLKDM